MTPELQILDLREKLARTKELSEKRNDMIDFLIQVYGHPKDTATDDQLAIYQNLLNEEMKLAIAVSKINIDGLLD